MKMFELYRDVDLTGISGTGVIAEGVVFSDGVAVLRWKTEYRSTVMYASVDDLLQIHGHGGTTRIVWLVDTPNDKRVYE